MLSVVIPAYNEVSHIGACLASLTDQSTEQEYEVIVVNNGSTDDTKKVAQSYTEKLNLKIIDEPRRGRGVARAAGFAKARGEIIFSTDADTQVPPDWMEVLPARLKNHPDWVAVSGTCKINDQSQLANLFFNWFQPFSMRLFRVIFGHYWLTGSNFAIHREAYFKAGGFNPAVSDLEDHELAFKVKKFGIIGFSRRPAVLTASDRFRGGMLKGLSQYIKAFTSRFLLKHHQPYDRDQSSS